MCFMTQHMVNFGKFSISIWKVCTFCAVSTVSYIVIQERFFKSCCSNLYFLLIFFLSACSITYRARCIQVLSMIVICLFFLLVLSFFSYILVHRNLKLQYFPGGLILLSCSSLFNNASSLKVYLVLIVVVLLFSFGQHFHSIFFSFLSFLNC